MLLDAGSGFQVKAVLLLTRFITFWVSAGYLRFEMTVSDPGSEGSEGSDIKADIFRVNSHHSIFY